MELPVDERIPLYVIPVRTPERILKEPQVERRPERKLRRIISAGPNMVVEPQEGGAADSAEVIHLRSEGLSLRRIADQGGVSHETVRKILRQGN